MQGEVAHREATPNQIDQKGQNLVIVADVVTQVIVGGVVTGMKHTLHLRVFDAAGTKVVDTDENDPSFKDDPALPKDSATQQRRGAQEKHDRATQETGSLNWPHSAR